MHAIALILQPFARSLIDGPAPAFAIDAPTEGSGKGLLAETVAAIATGRSAEVIPEMDGRDELRKAITSLLIGDPAIVLFDNCKGRISKASILSAITARTWKDRILGKSKMVVLPIRTTWIFTGNNIQCDREAARRLVWIRLNPKTERPWLRTGFKHELPTWVHRKRHELVRACLILIQNWIAEGRPLFTERTLGSFESWAQITGGILGSSGFLGFLENLEAFHEHSDQDSAAWSGFVSGWFKLRGTEPVQAKDLIDLARDLLPGEILGESERTQTQATRLGNALTQRTDRIYGDLRIVRAEVKGSQGQPRPGYALRPEPSGPREAGET